MTKRGNPERLGWKERGYTFEVRRGTMEGKPKSGIYSGILRDPNGTIVEAVEADLRILADFSRALRRVVRKQSINPSEAELVRRLKL